MRDEDYRDIVEACRDLVCSHDLNGVLLTVNLGGARALGYEPRELIHRNLRELLSPEAREELEAYLVVIRETGAASGFMRLQTKSGETRIWKYTNTLRTEGVQVPFVVGIAHDVTDILQAQRALRESEQRLSLAVQAGRMYGFDWDAATDVVVRSGQCVEILNWLDHPTRDTGQHFLASVHPEDHEAYAAPTTGLTPDDPTYHTSFRVLRPDGSVLWLESRGRVFFDEQGGRRRIIGMVADVTARKLAEEALAKVGAQVLRAQEEERARIARELHDDISQRLALLAMQLDQVRSDPNASAIELKRGIDEARYQTSQLENDVQYLSHRLHASKLQEMGIVAAAQTLCRELSERHDMKIHFTQGDMPPAVPAELSLCLFRVLQEALHNAVKHSGDRLFDVDLRGAGEEIVLTVRDAGRGFDPQRVSGGRGLGLISMRERVDLVKGSLSIDSRRGSGTTIIVHVPLRPQGDVMRSVG